MQVFPLHLVFVKNVRAREGLADKGLGSKYLLDRPQQVIEQLLLSFNVVLDLAHESGI